MPDTILGTVRDTGTITALRELADMLLCHGMTRQGRIYVRTQTAKRRKWLSGAVRDGSQRKRGRWVRFWIISSVCCCSVAKSCLTLDLRYIKPCRPKSVQLLEMDPCIYHNHAEQTGTFLISRLPPPSCGPGTSPMNMAIHVFPSINDILLQLQGESPCD